MKKTVFTIMLMLSAAFCSMLCPAEENGQNGFNDILDKYYYAITESWNPVVVSEENLPDFMYDLYGSTTDQYGYHFLDIDGNGTQVLFIGKCYYYSNSNEVIEAIYWLSEDGVKPVELPDTDCDIQYMGNGVIALSGYRDVLYTNTYQLQSIDGQVRPVFQDGYYMKDEKYYRNITEELGDTENDQELSEEEYYQLMDEGFGKQEVEYTPFSGYTPSSSVYSDARKQYQIPETFIIDDKTYTFPLSFDDLLNDGWSAEILSQDSWEEDGIHTDLYTYPAGGRCTKNGYTLEYSNVRKEDADPESDSTQSFFLNSIGITQSWLEEEPVTMYPLRVLNGITLGDRIDGLQDYLLSEGYKFTSSKEGNVLAIKVYFDSYSYDYLSISVDCSTGTISGLSYNYGKDPKKTSDYYVDLYREWTGR